MNNPKQKIKLTNPVHLLATGFGSGLAPLIPGTIGTLAALPFGILLYAYLPWYFYFAVIIIGTIIGIKLCEQTSSDMGTHDHGSIVWDEFIGLWITLFAIPMLTWQWVAVAFFLFRILDMWKPWPISWFDKNIHGGFGIMIDDIIAGIIAAVLIYLSTYLDLGNYLS